MLYQKHKKIGKRREFNKKIYARDGLRNEVNFVCFLLFFLCCFIINYNEFTIGFKFDHSTTVSIDFKAKSRIAQVLWSEETK